MPAVGVVIPWQAGCPHREAALEWVSRRYRALGWELIMGASPEGPWCKADAVADAVARTDAEVLVVADADVWTEALPAAVAVVAAGAGWVVPRCEVRRLNAAATAEVLAGAAPQTSMPLEQRAYRGVHAGGVVVLSRQSWESAPLDSRFRGWGSEDEAWDLALTGLVGPPVVLGWSGWPLWHLWHPPQARMSRSVGNPASGALLRRYRAVRGSQARLRALVEEGRPTTCPLSTDST